MTWSVAVILALAFLWRLLYLLQFSKSAFFDGLVLDESNYDAWAQAIAGGDILGKGTFTSNPLAPYLIGLVYAVTGRDLWVLRIVQSLVDTATCYFLFRTALHLFGRRAALVTLGLGAFYGPMIFFAGNLVATVWVLAFASAGLMLLSHPRPTAGRYVAAGALLGLAVLGRPNIVLMLPFLPAAARLRDADFTWRSAVRPTLFWAVGLALVLGPVGIRNKLEGGGGSPLPAHGGVNLWIGNNPSADGFFKTPRGSGLAGGQKSLVSSSIRQAEKATGHRMTAAESSAWWRRRALEFVFDQPAKALTLAWKKLVYSLSYYEKPLESNYYYAKTYSVILRWFTVGYGLVCGLALAALWLARRTWRQYALPAFFALAYALSMVLTYVSMRYRMPLVVGWLPLAGVAAVHLWDAWKARDRRRVAIAGGAIAVGLGVTNYPLSVVHIDHDIAHTHFMLGNLAQDKKDWNEALKHHLEAVTLYPEWGSYYNNLGLAYLRVGKPRQAAQTLEKAVAMGYGSRRVYRNLGKAYRALGRFEDAIQAFRKALEHSPRHFRTHMDLAALLEKTGRLEAARDLYEKALTLAKKPETRERVARYLAKLNRRIASKGLVTGVSPAGAPAEDVAEPSAAPAHRESASGPRQDERARRMP